MTERERALDRMELSVQGIGGIDSTTVTLRGGVNVLEGRNATNRTSLLQAIMAGLGGNAVSLKGDRDEGHVELTIDGETYTRTLRREGNNVRFGGDPYLSDSTEAELFAFLLETNETRQAVSAGGDLRDIIMRPVDTDEIERQIRELQAERTEVDNRIASLEQDQTRLPELEERRTRLESDLEEAREELAAAEADLESADRNAGAGQEETERLEAMLEDLNEARAERDDLSYRLETEREALDSARGELDATKTRLEDLPEVSQDQLTDIESRISELRQRKRTYDTRVSKLHRIVQFNEEMLEEDSTLRTLFEENETAVTDELLGATETTCWTCGSAVATDEIEAMLERLRELSQSQRRERTDLERDLDELTERRDDLERTRQERADLSDQIEALDADIERREHAIEDLEEQKAEIQERIEVLEDETEDLENSSDSDVPELQQRVNECALTVERLERERDDVVEEIETLEAKADEIDELERTREQITDQLSELRTRIDRLEAESVDAFNQHISELVELLEYDNLARVWIERKREGSDRGRTDESRFELHIVRTTDDGVTYEDTIDHLSESEREVVGIVFALAGYLVHEVYETVPVMLLDSLEAIDSERIALLVDYLADFSPTIVAALLPEDADALADSCTRIEEI